MHVANRASPAARTHSHELSPGRQVIGGSLACDVAIAACHDPELFAVEIVRSAYNKVSVTVTLLADGLRVAGSLRDSGSGFEVQAEPLEIESETHRFEISSPEITATPNANEGTGLAKRLSSRIGSAPAIGRLRTDSRVQHLLADPGKRSIQLLSAAAVLMTLGFASLAMRQTGLVNVPRVDAVSVERISDKTELRERLLALVAAADLTHRISIREDGSAIVLGGALSADQAARIEQALKHYRTQIDPAYTIRTAFEFDNLDGLGIAAAIYAPRVGVLQPNGQMVSVGGTLISGWAVEIISSAGIVLSRDGRRQTAILKSVDAFATGAIRPDREVRMIMRGVTNEEPAL